MFTPMSNRSFVCKSTDEKPVSPEVELNNGDCVIEIDTGLTYLYDEEDNTWIQQG